MKKLVLSKNESIQLLRDGFLITKRNRFIVLVGLNILEDNYKIKIINPYDKLVFHKDMERWTK